MEPNNDFRLALAAFASIWYRNVFGRWPPEKTLRAMTAAAEHAIATHVDERVAEFVDLMKSGSSSKRKRRGRTSRKGTK
jgi:hypothetical protein